MSEQPKPSENGNDEAQRIEHGLKLAEERRRVMEVMRKDIALFRARIKGEPPPEEPSDAGCPKAPDGCLAPPRGETVREKARQ